MKPLKERLRDDPWGDSARRFKTLWKIRNYLQRERIINIIILIREAQRISLETERRREKKDGLRDGHQDREGS